MFKGKSSHTVLASQEPRLSSEDFITFGLAQLLHSPAISTPAFGITLCYKLVNQNRLFDMQ